VAHEQFASELNISLLRMRLQRDGSKAWKAPGRAATCVEQAVLQYYEADGWLGYWGEGGLLLNLIKTMAFPTVPAEQKSTCIESLYASVANFGHDSPDPRWLLENVKQATRKQVSRNAQYLLSREGGGAITDYFPGLELWMFLGLFDSLGREKLYQIASIFAEDPYAYRKGWPDVTMWNGKAVRFLEAKAPGDATRKSQWIIIRRFVKPLSLDFALVDVQPLSVGEPYPAPEVIHVGLQGQVLERADAQPCKPIPQPISASMYWCDAGTTDPDQIADAKAYSAAMTTATKANPALALSMALRWKPLPDFDRAAKSARALIRQRRKAEEDAAGELHLLYCIAALASFGDPYAKRCQMPGANVTTLIPVEVFGGLDIDYDRVGYEKLDLLNLPDIRMIVSAWGEPTQHTTLHDQHQQV
jgi:hypothetical protein